MFARSTKTRIGQVRPSFTLIELLISISIIGVMAGMVLFTLAGAQQDALRGRTKVTIQKINAVILERWESYRYRSVKLSLPPEAVQKKWISPRQVAGLRTLFLKDMMRMEMPDNFLDLQYTPTNTSLMLSNGTAVIFQSYPGREYNVLRNYFGIKPPIIESDPAAIPVPATKPSPHWSDTLQASECLYAIVSHSAVGGGSALEGFHASEIADIDSDGYPEFIDAWGTPIGWIRWPAGYDSTLNFSYKASSPDAFDPLRTAAQWNDPSLTQKPWTLVPLIVSAGADREFGIEQPDNIFAISREVFIPSTDAPSVGRIINEGQVSDNLSNHYILLE